MSPEEKQKQYISTLEKERLDTVRKLNLIRTRLCTAKLKLQRIKEENHGTN